MNTTIKRQIEEQPSFNSSSSKNEMECTHTCIRVINRKVTLQIYFHISCVYMSVFNEMLVKCTPKYIIA